MRRLPDEQPATEHALEDLPVAVALNAPARERQVAGRLQVQIDAVAVAPQLGRADRLVTAALEMLSEPEDHRTALQQLLVALGRQRRDLAQLRRALAVVAADLGDQGALAWVET